MSEERELFERGRKKYHRDNANRRSEFEAKIRRAHEAIDWIESGLKEIFLPRGYKFDRSASGHSVKIRIDTEHDSGNNLNPDKRNVLEISHNADGLYLIRCSADFGRLSVADYNADKERVFEVAAMFYEVTGGIGAWGDQASVNERKEREKRNEVAREAARIEKLKKEKIEDARAEIFVKLVGLFFIVAPSAAVFAGVYYIFKSIDSWIFGN